MNELATAIDGTFTKAAVRLARSMGHLTSCQFRGCTCGAVGEQKDALTDFWREYERKMGVQ